MTLEDRLRNPQWIGVPGEKATLDVEQATKTMGEAASELTNYKLGFATQTEKREQLEAENGRLRDVISFALIHAEQCWLGHYGDNPEGGSEPRHIRDMRAALLPKDGTK